MGATLPSDMLTEFSWALILEISNSHPSGHPCSVISSKLTYHENPTESFSQFLGERYVYTYITHILFKFPHLFPQFLVPTTVWPNKNLKGHIKKKNTMEAEKMVQYLLLLKKTQVQFPAPQPPKAPVPDDLMPSSDLLGEPGIHVVHIHTWSITFLHIK